MFQLHSSRINKSHIDPDVRRSDPATVPGAAADPDHARDLRLAAGDRISQQIEDAHDLRDGAWITALHGPRLARRLLALVRAGIECLSKFFPPHARDLTARTVRAP